MAGLQGQNSTVMWKLLQSYLCPGDMEGLATHEAYQSQDCFRTA